MSIHNLPPVRHLPHWTRVGTLGKSCSPPHLPAIHQQQLRVLPPPARSGASRAAEVSCRCVDADPRVASMQKNIQFLQQQHTGTLQKLHAEIEYLRRENKELQYKLIMEPPKSSRKGMTYSRRGNRPPAQGREARTGLYLEEPLQDTRTAHDQALSSEDGSETLCSTRQDLGADVKGGLITSLQPLRIHSNPSHPPRAPTLQECEVIIRQLYNANSLQSQEIIRVKALLRDIVLSKKITPENYILTKAYLVDANLLKTINFQSSVFKRFRKKRSGPLGLRWSSRPSNRALAPAWQRGRGGRALCRGTASKGRCIDRIKKLLQHVAL